MEKSGKVFGGMDVHKEPEQFLILPIPRFVLRQARHLPRKKSLPVFVVLLKFSEVNWSTLIAGRVKEPEPRLTPDKLDPLRSNSHDGQQNGERDEHNAEPEEIPDDGRCLAINARYFGD